MTTESATIIACIIVSGIILLSVIIISFCVYLSKKCKHNYRQQSKKEYNWDDIEVVAKTEYYFQPLTQKITYSKTVEILVCEKCGDIKKIEY